MRIAVAHLKSASPYSQSKPIASVKDRNEKHDEFELRTWRERCHTDENGMVFIPPMTFKACLQEAAKYKSIKLPGGGGKATYTKHFDAGVMCKEVIPLGIHVDNVEGERLFLPSNAKRGGGTRVWKTMPLIRSWEGDVEFLVLDEIIGNEIFETHLVDAGQFIGIGRFRPRNRGYYGRFSVEGIEWTSA